VSFEDDLVKTVLNLTPSSLLNRTQRDGGPFKYLSHVLDGVQAKQAARTAEMLVEALGYDAVLAGQQLEIYAERREMLRRKDLSEQIRVTIGQVIRTEVTAAAGRPAGQERLWPELRKLFPVTVTPESLAAERGCEVARLPPDFVAERVTADAERAYDRREAELTPPLMRELERRVTLSIIDRFWRQHLDALPDLLKSIELRNPGGKPPLADYRREAAQLFTAMRAAVSKHIVTSLFNLKIEYQEE
jgi:preprotein translocase subunit SecA